MVDNNANIINIKSIKNRYIKANGVINNDSKK